VIEQLCGIGPTAILDRAVTTGSGSPLRRGDHPPMTVKIRPVRAPAKLTWHAIIKLNRINSRWLSRRSREGPHDKAMIK
jgi:hypothetical protein